MHDALGNALVVEVRDLLAEDEVLRATPGRAGRPSANSGCRRPARPGWWSGAAPLASTRTRIQRTDGRIGSPGAARVPSLSDALTSLSVLRADASLGGSTSAPSCGACALSWPYSSGLFALNGIASDVELTSAARSAMRSPVPFGTPRALPLSVLRCRRRDRRCGKRAWKRRLATGHGLISNAWTKQVTQRVVIQA